MLGKPKYNYGDTVKFKVTYHDKEYDLTGKIEIIDAFGTWEDNSDVSYDIMVDRNNNPIHRRVACLFKHIREDGVELIEKSTQ